MLTIEGTYDHGKVELAEKPRKIERSRVLVTFLDSNLVDLSTHGIDENRAADLRARLQSFTEDWDRLEAAIYDED